MARVARKRKMTMPTAVKPTTGMGPMSGAAEPPLGEDARRMLGMVIRGGRLDKEGR